MKSIDLENVLLFHHKIISEFGGSYGIRDIGLIESAMNRAFMTFDEEDLYKNVEEKIAVVTHSLIKNHGFIDGNKRIGISVMLLLLKLNGIEIEFEQDELVKLGLEIADGLVDENGVLGWIVNRQTREKEGYYD